MESNKSNRSLFLYTGLIFVAAIIVIAVSFFSQINAEKQHGEYGVQDMSNNSIVEKTAMLSEENRILLETTNSLNKKIQEMTEDNSELTKRLLTLEKQITNTEMMYDIFNNIQKGKIQLAADSFEKLDPLFFTETQEEFYKYLQKRIRQLY